MNMVVNTMNNYEAIFRRQSIRNYAEEPIVAEPLAQIITLTVADRINTDIALDIQLADGVKMQQVLSGIIGNLGKIIAPHYLVASASPQGNYLEEVGYAVENLVLRLTAAGIATCWIGGHVKPEQLAAVATIPDGHKPVVMVALGMPAAHVELYRVESESKHRKTGEELTLAGEVNQNWELLLPAMLAAPSAANTQPWRFAFDGDTMHLYAAQPNVLLRPLFEHINHVDMGIVLCHCVVAGKHEGFTPVVSALAAPTFAGMRYFVSVKL